jgi:glycosyltransferase involved in cell wall biosynthesis
LPLRILHAIHDFLPRHQAGSEIYAWTLCREMAARHSVTVVCAEYDTARAHGEVTWRAYDGLPVAEIVNNWRCHSFADSYRSPSLSARLHSILQAVQPHVLHLHSLLNLSFDLPELAASMGIPVVATLHDYSLVCPSGGQRIHQADAHLCLEIDTARCARCFRQSPFFGQVALGKVAAVARPGILRRAAAAAARQAPQLASAFVRTAQRATAFALTAHEIDERLAAAHELFDRVAVWIAPSPSMAREFAQLGFDPSRIRVADYGFDTVARVERRRPTLPLRLGFVGTLVWHKGVHVLLDAVRTLPPDTYELTIFGDPGVFPAYTAQLRKRAEGLPVSFAGPFSRAQATDVYSHMDVLVVPSIWMENSPLVIHEAFMAGVPVVGSRIGGIADLIEDGVSGYLAEPASVASLGTLLRRLVDHPQMLEELADRRSAVRSIADDARTLEGIYEQLLRPAGARSV